ncbi:MAG: hypothetical protein KDE09_09690 [Anaerolineales bacterium]|nr:hypothetical protein [Anaerolineales bacterium]MCB0009632.1 hypothetical protein [Anaerolineales bacterium]MCB0018049.1 hypothetical protein [Anaerolineales bacterium]MCB8960455.1 hypothetical protein [Ardenticatenales bacterium]
MFRPINWRSFPRDFLIIQIGFSLFGLAVAMLIRANLGTNPWTMLSVALSEMTNLSVGTITIFTGLAVLGVAIVMREQIGWGTLGNILFIGPWSDLFLWLIPQQEHWFWQAVMLLGGIALLGVATGIYVSVQAGAGPRDSLMLAVARLTGWTLRVSRASLEVVVFVIAWALGGPAGIGTIAIALLIGPAVQWGFRLLGVEKKAPPATKPA